MTFTVLQWTDSAIRALSGKMQAPSNVTIHKGEGEASSKEARI